MISVDEDYTVENWILSEHTEITFICSRPLKDLLVRFKGKLEVYFLNSQWGSWLPGLNRTFASTSVAWGQGQGPVVLTVGPSRLLWHGNDESGQPVFKSCVLPRHCSQKKFSFLQILITIALEHPMQWYNTLPWSKIFLFICFFSPSRTRHVPCS